MSIENFVTWEFLASFAGCVAATALIVQFAKPVLDKLVHIPTQFVSYVIAIVVLLVANLFTGQLTLESGVLILFNGVIVSLTSNGGYDAIKKIFIKNK